MGHTVLLVEDNPATRKMVTCALEHRGHEVVEAADGATALELMDLHHPSLVLLDLVLPDVSGFSLVPKLRERSNSNDTMIVAFSGLLSKLEEARLAAVGFDDVITKPIEPDRLVAEVEALLPQVLPEEDRFGTGSRALIADDDPMQLKLLRYRMRQLGFDVMTAADGKEALELVLNDIPDIVIADALMPRLDGFELAMALRRQPAFSERPLLLVTSSYIEPADRELARRSGATDLVVRTPQLTELIAALRRAFARPVPSIPPEPIAVIEEERGRRVVKQLERQVHLNSGLAQRCAALSGELAVLTRISEVVLKNRSLDAALDEALAACFDAGGISVGALYHLHDDALSVRSLGSTSQWNDAELASFFGQARLLQRCIHAGQPTQIPSPDVPESDTLLMNCGARAILIIPLSYLQQPLGALVMFARASELAQTDWYAFAQAIANQISQVLALATALGERAKAEQLAQERTAFLDALLEQAPDFVAYVDPEGIVRYVGRFASDERRNDLVGKPMDCLPIGGSSEEHRRRLDRVLSVGESVSWEETYPHAGTDVTYWCKMGPIRRNGVVEGAVLLARDVSERKKAEAQLIAADRMMSVGMLAAGVAHEINNPLAAVVGNLEVTLAELKKLSSRTAIPKEIADAIADARDASDRIRIIVRDMRVFSRAEDDKREAVDVEKLLESTLRMAWNEIRHRAGVQRDYAGVPMVHANDARLGQVFLNLIVNAAHAIAEGNCESHAIRVSTSMDGDRVVVRIADTGCGIPHELQSRVFTPFFTTKPPGVGTGLGLSICQRIVNSFHGEISFESTVGRGTEFCVELPRARFSVSRRPLPMTAPCAARRGRVLVVDDDELVGDVLKRVLAEDHEVVTANSGVIALELIQNGERFDVIMCDLMMPQVTGMQLYSMLQQFDGALASRIVFLTGGAFTPWARTFLDSVSNHRVEKPFDRQGVRALVNGLVR